MLCANWVAWLLIILRKGYCCVSMELGRDSQSTCGSSEHFPFCPLPSQGGCLPPLSFSFLYKLIWLQTLEVPASSVGLWVPMQSPCSLSPLTHLILPTTTTRFILMAWFTLDPSRQCWHFSPLCLQYNFPLTNYLRRSCPHSHSPVDGLVDIWSLILDNQDSTEQPRLTSNS